ncbi:hypothetical protein CP533_0557, partial [Ophiocordyceps camponoti-saundersi (nom. inval.)]
TCHTPRRIVHEAEPLSRGGSSDGSSVVGAYLFDYDSPSPLPWTEGGVDEASSSVRQQQQQDLQSRDFPVCCLHPGCTSRPFKRRADLDRHYKHRHAPDSVKDSFICDYPRCSRHQDPFHRLDHFRDHLREFHKEDIEKRSNNPVVVMGGRDDARHHQQQQRPVVDLSAVATNGGGGGWWRCRRCLKRVHHTDTCPSCKTPSQPKRKDNASHVTRQR